MISTEQLLTGLQIAVFVGLLIVLYHILFIVVDLRKVMRRVSDVTAEVESMILKPISMADQILQWIMDMVNDAQKKHQDKKKHEKTIDQ